MELYRKRSVYSGTSLLADLKCQEYSGQYKKFTRMAPANFELLMNLLGPKIVKRDTGFQEAIPRPERLVVTLQFWATENLYTHLQYLFHISQQTMSDCTWSVWSYCEALMENIQVKNCILYRANCFALKIDGLEQRNKIYN
jgi:hypothetical protein